MSKFSVPCNICIKFFFLVDKNCTFVICIISGDNLNTAVYVARECGMISMKDSVCRLVASNDETVSRVNVTRTPFKVNLLPSVIPNWKVRIVL